MFYKKYLLFLFCGRAWSCDVSSTSSMTVRKVRDCLLDSTCLLYTSVSCTYSWFGNLIYTPVSYTHLDVYKRQFTFTGGSDILSLIISGQTFSNHGQLRLVYFLYHTIALVCLLYTSRCV